MAPDVHQMSTGSHPLVVARVKYEFVTRRYRSCSRPSPYFDGWTEAHFQAFGFTAFGFALLYFLIRDVFARLVSSFARVLTELIAHNSYHAVQASGRIYSPFRSIRSSGAQTADVGRRII